MEINGGKDPKNDGEGEQVQATVDPQLTGEGGVTCSIGRRIVTHQFEYLPRTSPDSTSNNLAETTIGLGTSLSFVLVG